MKRRNQSRPNAWSSACLVLGLAAFPLYCAGATTDISNVPLATGSSSAALPNLMFILDDSGSMGWTYLPDHVNDSLTCKTRSGSSTNCQEGDPPYYANQNNGVYYNPEITYTPAANFDGTSMPSQTNPNNVLVDAFTSSTKIAITTQYPEMVYCKQSSNNAATASNYPSNCRRNGYSTTATLATTTTVNFYYPVNTANNHGSNPSGTETYPSSTFPVAKTKYGAPFYYTILPREHCSDVNLTTCELYTTPTGAFIHPAPVRWCTTAANANNTGKVSGGSGPNCQAKYDSSHKYPRYGQFKRVDIISSVTSYPKAATRTDCAGATCTYAEELTNFSNWYAYYRTRMQMMKSAAGRAFLPLDDRYRVGLVTINPGKPVSSSKYLKLDKFEPNHKKAWYDKFYAQTSNSSTPLREALSRVGRHYAGKTDGINQGMNDDPIQYSCQRNFALLTTDGFWNGNAGQTISGGSIGNQDNVDSTVEPKWSARSNGTYDGGISGASNTLADVALYYYKTDLRPDGSIGALGTDVSKNDVRSTTKDFNKAQHMTTFTLGIVDGLMTYRPDYETNTTSANDFYRIKANDNGCAFSSTSKCNWPLPAADTLTAIDDLWHAAVNGRGIYYSARDSKTLTKGLSDALLSLEAEVGAASASATSSPNITPTDNAIFSSTYTTVEWSGEVVAQTIDTTTGEVVPTITWSAQAGLDAMVSDSTDTRTIYFPDANGVLTPFKFASMNATEQAYFKDKCSPAALTQCPDLSAAELASANSGTNMVNFLRGQTQHEAALYREREHVLGDTVNAKPVYVRRPMWAFADGVEPTYAEFQLDNATRQGALYIAANDGMLHAFNGNSGAEMWAYVPRMLLPELYKLAEKEYASMHRYYLDGSPEVMDVYDGSSWRTILVGGLNSGGRGYYALDVTVPNDPQALWEFCSDAALCANNDTDLGLTYGNPIITKRASDGKWVVLVTSGYNNVSPGTGRGYLYVLDALSGTVLQKIGTGAGSTTSPSGLGRIAAWADNFAVDNTAKYVYGGDLAGNFWRFDLTSGTPGVQRLATLVDGNGRPQSVTTKPELSLVDNHRMIHIGTGRYLGVSDLSDPSTWTPPSTDAYQQSFYTFKDKGSDYGNLRDDLVQQTIEVINANSRKGSTESVDLNTTDGWFVDFNPGNASPGERVNIDPQLILGTLVVVTNVPNMEACSVGGESWIYFFDYKSGQYVNTSPNQVVGQKLGDAITVGVVVFQLPDGTIKAIATDAKGSKQAVDIPIGSGSIDARRTSWRELIK
ncbi:MAG: hypothetical protein KIS79_05030 [Burkholderiales bacterium]|nr:hypothetical protein [Burkholderiales bacterium]